MATDTRNPDTSNSAAPEPGQIHKPGQAQILNRERGAPVPDAPGPWLIVGTNPRQEGLVMSQLRPDQFSVYRPMTQALRWRDNRRVLVAEPVFPAYLFVRPLVSHPVRIFGKAGVAWVFPRGIADAVIAKFKAEERDGFIDLVADLEPKAPEKTPEKATGQKGEPAVKVGDRVKTVDGLYDFVVTAVDARDRVAGLSAFMNGNATLMVPMSRVVKVG